MCKIINLYISVTFKKSVVYTILTATAYLELQQNNNNRVSN